MTIQRKSRIIVALLVSSVFLLQNCATILSGFRTSQKIPVTSSPSGAKIIVDGEEIGYAPVNLKLNKKNNHIIRIEKQGYNPVHISIERNTSGSSAFLSSWGNLYFGSLIGALAAIGALVLLDPGLSNEGVDTAIVLAGLIIGVGGTFYVDSKSGAKFTLSPKELNVKLTTIKNRPRSYLIFLDAKLFKNIKWIRIKCADSDAEDEVINLN
jgi:hypothetical protein